MLPTVDTEIDDSRMTRPAIGQHAHDQAERSWPHIQQLLSEPCVLIAHCLSSREQVGSWEVTGLGSLPRTASCAPAMTASRAAIAFVAIFLPSSVIAPAARASRSLAFSACRQNTQLSMDFIPASCSFHDSFVRTTHIEKMTPSAHAAPSTSPIRNVVSMSCSFHEQ